MSYLYLICLIYAHSCSSHVFMRAKSDIIKQMKEKSGVEDGYAFSLVALSQ